MSLSNTNPASNSSILYPYENPQTDLGGLESFRSNREVISICCHTTPAVSTTTEVVSQRLIQSADSINFIDRTKVPENTILVSMDVTSLYTNIPQEREYIHIQCARPTTLSTLKDTPPIPTSLLDRRSIQANVTGELIPVLWQIDS